MTTNDGTTPQAAQAPQADGAATQDPASTPTRSAAARPILVATSIIGAVALLAVGTSAASGVVGLGLGTSGAVSTVAGQETRGITALKINASAADVTLAFADVGEATLEAVGPRSAQWNMSRDGDELRVDGPRGVFGFCFFGSCNREQTVTLTLPLELQDRLIDVDAKLGAGTFEAEGAFGELDFEVGAGDMTVTGSARALGLDMGAGDFTADLADVSEVDLSVSAGTARVSLTGSAPSDVDVEVSAGTLDLTLPNAAYRVEAKATMGDIDNQLRTDSQSRNLVSARVSAGDITLRQGK
ncbi:DUF4097 domain-containing protein [Leucobacter insecticola]|uniref:DUF4097 domain-containing protein n=1 Tax=Leucobacter insecticola TaxID=2714934 RepID=A0A6G8FGQ7_9MICO|nr:DUF4097 family beta strand repeat-containing protein [Leucobacter insecticola]QIM15534.1 DUF4097 domain-containing protein [Leucobacter insecticola]